jgi:16S rRNA processing protein RimM
VSERICVAQIGAAHGIRGEVKLKSFTADPLAVRDYGPLTSEDGALRFEIEAARPAKSHLVVRFRGIADRNAAERLTGLKLFVLRERLPPPEPDEFYHADLIGLAAVGTDGSAIGTVVAVHDFGAGDILELRPQTGGATLMVPFNETFVPGIDIANGRIIVAPPATDAGKRGEGQAPKE